MKKRSAKDLAKEWKLDVKQPLYSEWGNWYGLITTFPAALLDKNGYIVIHTQDDLMKPGIRLTKQINIPDGISKLHNYVCVIPSIPEEIVESDLEEYLEGKGVQIIVNKYERDPKAREKCIKHHKAICAACGIDMAVKYGKGLEGFIHVHHKVPLSKIKQEYKIDPISDLIPVCPNCHAVIHKFSPPLTIENLKKRLTEASE